MYELTKERNRYRILLAPVGHQGNVKQITAPDELQAPISPMPYIHIPSVI